MSLSIELSILLIIFQRHENLYKANIAKHTASIAYETIDSLAVK